MCVVWWKCFAPVVCLKWISAIPSRWMEPCSCHPWGQCLLMQQMQGELRYHVTINVQWRYGFMRKWLTRLSHYSVNPEISTLTSHRICTISWQAKFVQFLPIWLDRFTYYNFKMYKYEMRIPCKPKMQHITEQPLAAFRFISKGEWHPLKIRVKKCMHVVCSWTLIKTSTEHFWRLSFYVHQTACHCLPFRSTACFCVATD